jgi:hypothetical protein
MARKRLVAALALLAFLPASRAEDPPGFAVLTDVSWSGSASEAPGWKTAGFDESGWRTVRANETAAGNQARYGTLNMFGQPSPAAWIWANAPGDLCFVRRVFTVKPGFQRAEMLLSADDRAEVFLNGTPVAVSDTLLAPWGVRGGAVLVDLLPWLQDGENVLAAKLVNRQGPKGFVAELRIDGQPFLALPPREGSLPESVGVELERLAAELDAPALDSREAATAELSRLVERHGFVVGARVAALARKAASPEVRWRARVAWSKILPRFGPPEQRGDLWGFGRLGLYDLEDLWAAPDDREVVAMRHLVAASVHVVADPDRFARFVGHELDGATDHQAVRIVAFASFLDLREAAPELVALLARRPATDAGALAASALGRLGDDSHASALERAGHCGFAPTERAVARALAAIRSR